MTPDFEGELNELQALTDTTLARLGVDELLDELLNRVRDILDADTAAVLLVSEGSGELEARAARGIEAEVRQGVRVRLGTGFAGRIASTRASPSCSSGWTPRPCRTPSCGNRASR